MSEGRSPATTVAWVAGIVVLVMSAIYTADCRRASPTFDPACYQEGVFSVVSKDLLMQLLLGAGGFALGFNLPNPRIDAERRRQALAEFERASTSTHPPAPPPLPDPGPPAAPAGPGAPPSPLPGPGAPPPPWRPS